jgi:hypothetical protein
MELGKQHAGGNLSVEQHRRAAAMRMGSLSIAGHHAAGDLEELFPQTAQYIRDTAVGFEHISNLLKDPRLDEVATLIGNLSRKQPVAVVAGAVLAGLGLSWFLSNSRDGPNRPAAGASANDGEGGADGVQ